LTSRTGTDTVDIVIELQIYICYSHVETLI
jgi:hypothetical protein